MSVMLAESDMSWRSWQAQEGSSRLSLFIRHIGCVGRWEGAWGSWLLTSVTCPQQNDFFHVYLTRSRWFKSSTFFASRSRSPRARVRYDWWCGVRCVVIPRDCTHHIDHHISHLAHPSVSLNSLALTFMLVTLAVVNITKNSRPHEPRPHFSNFLI